MWPNKSKKLVSPQHASASGAIDMRRFRQPNQREIDAELAKDRGFFDVSTRKDSLPPLSVVKELVNNPTRERLGLAIQAGHLTVSQAVDFAYRLGIVDAQKSQAHPKPPRMPDSVVVGVPTEEEREAFDTNMNPTTLEQVRDIREKIYLEQSLLIDGI